MRRAATFGEEIARRGLGPDQAAVLADVNPSTVRRIISGTVRAQPKTVVSFAKALDVAALRMRKMMDAHYLAAHPEEDLGGGDRHVA
jgi:hypothetical protein